MPSTVGWFVDDGQGQYAYGGIISATIDLLGYVDTMLLTYLTIVSLLLLKRFLQIHFGDRVQPDASKAVIITGATSGLGLDITKRLYARGFTVFGCYYNDKEAAYKELRDLATRTVEKRRSSENGTSAGRLNHLFPIKMDLRVGQSIADSSREIMKLMEVHDLRLHCLINNATTSADVPFELVTGQAIRDIVDTNLVGAYRLTNEFVFRIIKDKGRVVNVGSGSQFFPGPAYSIFGSSIAALSYFTESLNQDLKPYGAACYSIVLGNYTIHTNSVTTRIALLEDYLAQLNDEERKVYKHKIDHYGRLLNFMSKGTLMQSTRLAKLHGFELSNDDRKATSVHCNSLFEKSRLVGLADDNSNSADEDLNSVIDCYESAVTLSNPPRCLYAGNTSYQFLWGPILDHLPRSVTNQLASHVSGSM